MKLTLSGNDAQKTLDSSNLLSRLKRIEGRLVRLKKGTRLQLTHKYEHRDTCVNVDLSEVTTSLERLLAEGAFRNGRLMAADADFSLESRKRGRVLQRLKPTAAAKPPPPLSHDREKPLAEAVDADFLQALGVTGSNGKPRAGKSDKLRQIRKFVETISALVRRGMGAEEGTEDADDGSVVGGGRPLRVVDAGCGRGYLTFATHSFFASKGWDVETVGVEVRPDLVAEMNDVATSLDGFGGLRFEHSTVADFLGEQMDGANADESRLDVLIALHACDTATDDALWCGIANQARIIVVAPCCHKEVRRRFEQASRSRRKGQPALGGALGGTALRHGIYRERTAEMVTDTLRAMLLEIAGYDVSVFEFIGGEHTAKNVMVTASRRTDSKRRSAAEIDALRARLRELSSEYGVESQSLARWMGESLGSEAPEESVGGQKVGVGGRGLGAAASQQRLPSPGQPPRNGATGRPSRRTEPPVMTGLSAGGFRGRKLTKGIGLRSGRRRLTVCRAGPMLASASPSISASKPTAVYALIMASFLTFLADNVLRLPFAKALYLYHSRWSWWQPLTSVFCHGSRAHLSGNVFLLLLFGRSVEDDLGWGGLLLAFAFCGISANLASLVLLPTATVSLGASGAVFGLFTVSVFSRLSVRELEWRRVIEVLILGEFVVGKMFSELRIAAAGGMPGVNHVAHLAGAVSGIVLVMILRILLDKLERGADQAGK